MKAKALQKQQTLPKVDKNYTFKAFTDSNDHEFKKPEQDSVKRKESVPKAISPRRNQSLKKDKGESST